MQPQDIRKKILAAITAAKEAYVIVICLLKGTTGTSTADTPTSGTN